MAVATDDTFDSNGVKIRYVTEGEGEAVVLIHGWMGDSSMWGRDSYGNTKLNGMPGFRVIALDCRGHGKSDKPHDPEKYGTEMAADVVRLLDHLNIKRAHIIGYSMGAFIAGKVAATNPDRVISVIYGGQAPLVSGPNKTDAGGGEVEAFAKAVDEGKGMGAYIVEVSPPGKKPTLEQANGIAKLYYGGKDLKAWAMAGMSFGALEVSAKDLRKCRAPSLFIYGENDSENTKKRVAEWRKILDRTEEKVVPGADHITTLIKPEFGSSIVAFLQANKSK